MTFLLRSNATRRRRSCGLSGVFVVVFLSAVVPARAQTSDGATLFAKNCTICHTTATDARAPSIDALHQLAPEAVVYALTGGAMRYQGLSLSGTDRAALAEYLTGRKPETAAKTASMTRCTSGSWFS